MASFLVHALFLVAVLPSISIEAKKPNVPVMVRVITDMPEPKKEEPPIKTETAALSNADRKAKAPKVVERKPKPKTPKKRIEAKAVEPIKKETQREEKVVQKPVEKKPQPPKPEETLVAKTVEQPKVPPEPKAQPATPPQQEVPKLEKPPPISKGPDLEPYAQVEAPVEDSEVLNLDTRDFRYISYFAHIKRKIELSWTYPKEADRAGIYGELILRFTLLRNGDLEEVRIIRSSGSRILDEEAIRAVKFANPFNPFPKRITKNRLHVNAVFNYLPLQNGLS
jgi:protein TonB